MSKAFVPDNTVLVKFATIARMDLLASVVRNNGQWCGSVANECDLSARVRGLETIAQAHEIFGDPLLLETQKEILDTAMIRTSLAAPGDGKTKHLGEAESIAIIWNREIPAVFITDDLNAARRAKEFGIPTFSTWYVLRLAVRADLIDVNDAYDHVRDLGGHRLGYIYLSSRERWIHWCVTNA